jgi:hypothetical protein
LERGGSFDVIFVGISIRESADVNIGVEFCDLCSFPAISTPMPGLADCLSCAITILNTIYLPR